MQNGNLENSLQYKFFIWLGIENGYIEGKFSFGGSMNNKEPWDTKVTFFVMYAHIINKDEEMVNDGVH